MEGSGVIRRYRDFLPITDTTPIISLSEGSTPLIEAPNIVQALGGGFRLFVKYEGLNPTGSFKDRGMTQAVSTAAERGVRAIVCASLFFTVMHLAVADWQGLPGLFLLSLGLGWVFTRPGRLAAPITLHMLFNGLNIYLAS